MEIKIKYTLKDFNKGQIISKYGIEKGGSTQLFLADTCFRRMVKYVPWETGALATTVTVRPGSVTYDQEYAHRQYTTNKGKGIRGKYWDRKMISAERNIVTKEVEDQMKKTKGNK